MIDQNLDYLANLLCRNRRQGLTSDIPFDLLRSEDDAWAVQSAAISAFANDAVGYALIGTCPAIRGSLGLASPIYCPIPVGTVLQDSHGPFRLPQGFIGAQCEIVFTIGGPLGADHWPITRDQFCKAILSYQPAIGLVGRRGHLTGQPHLAAIADYAFHVSTIVDKYHEPTGLEAMDRIDMRASINNVPVFQSASGEGLVDPINSALWLVNDLIARSNYLSAGDIVATGSIIPMLLQILPGQELKVELSGVGDAAARFL
ncbi:MULTISPECIES: 2-keto-4-pentenoate hydratase [Alphaproteobacteria]|jgi:2-keto-4-pentenoate hydratase|uniref:Hydratase n=2 Tax=Alphaproteobacteria TaxID=28211 RepID=A0A1V8RQQ3_9HYPH|nr:MULTISPECIES: fumarylacetoacetate hydrolase family protein [Alphaproteobacteria]OQM75478.1 hydratase [Pseudaminobacter manganicus]